MRKIVSHSPNLFFVAFLIRRKLLLLDLANGGLAWLIPKIWVYWRTMIFFVKNWQLRGHLNMQFWWRHFLRIKFLTSARYSRRNCLHITKTKKFVIGMFNLSSIYWYVQFQGFYMLLCICMFIVQLFSNIQILVCLFKVQYWMREVWARYVKCRGRFVEYEVHLN